MKILFAILIIYLSLFMPPTHITAPTRFPTDETYLLKYEANALPQDSVPAWIAYDNLDLDTEEIVAGKLHLGVVDFGELSDNGYQNGSIGLDGTDANIEFKAKVIDLPDNGLEIYFFPQTINAIVIRLSEAKVEFGEYADTDTVVFDTTDDYHIYKLVWHRTDALHGNVSLYIDTVLKGTIAVFNDVQPLADRIDMAFTLSAGDNAELYIDYLYAGGIITNIHTATPTHIGVPTHF